MPLTKAQKKEIIADIQTRAKEKPQLLFCDLTGTNMGDLQTLRRKLRGVGAELKAVKKSLLARALAGVEETKEINAEQWQNAVSITFAREGEVDAAKSLYEFAKAHKETFSILGGFFEGAVLDASGVISLAQTPGRQELYGQLACLLNAVPTNFVRVLHAVQRNFVITLSEIAKKA